MEVIDNKVFPEFPGYSIEWGYATWSKDKIEANKEWSIRNRYDRADGGFNYAGSSEVPWVDFNRMITESIKEKQFSNSELKIIFKMSLSRLVKNIFRL
jgi:hypothetical protein